MDIIQECMVIVMVAGWNMPKKYWQITNYTLSYLEQQWGNFLLWDVANIRIWLLWDQVTGKAFLLKPLESIFKTFATLASDNYTWVELTMLRSFFWMISDGLLSWFSGKVCHYYLKVTKWGYQHLKIIFHVISI